MVNKKTASSSSSEPTTLNPDMSREIMELLKSQGIEGLELDAEALKVLTQFAGKEFEETYKRIAEEKAKEGGDQKKESENAESMEQEN